MRIAHTTPNRHSPSRLFFFAFAILLFPCVVVAVSEEQEREPSTPCNSSLDCRGDDEYCSTGFCRASGECATRLDCLNLANDFLFADCPGYLVCHQGSCEMSCGSWCPAGQELAQDCKGVCAAAPCDQPYESCVEDACGGCRAYFIDAAGNHVCRQDESQTEQGTPCTSELNCIAGKEYCGGGVCREFQSCDTLIDCLNPENDFLIADCVGFLVCTDAGQCEMSCSSGHYCPDNKDPTSCGDEDPCLANSCNEPFAHCWVDQCGGTCSPMWINEAGFQVCSEFSDSSSTCTSDQDCATGTEYCMRGECQSMTTCSTLTDCYNPSNVYDEIDCVGFKTCEDGTCGKKCSVDECADREEKFECWANPCDVSNCTEPYVSCQADYCGGCRALYFDAAGNQVCQDTVAEEAPPTCASDSECHAGREYCADGYCRQVGTCFTWMDCENPSNEFPSQECGGFLDCVEGHCEHSCTEQACPNSQPAVDCMEETPCTTTTCSEDFVTCIESNCLVCKATFLNAAGQQVCSLESYCSESETPCTGDSVAVVMCLMDRIWKMLFCLTV